MKFARGFFFVECSSPEVKSFYTKDKSCITSVMVVRRIKLHLEQFMFHFAVYMTRLLVAAELSFFMDNKLLSFKKTLDFVLGITKWKQV